MPGGWRGPNGSRSVPYFHIVFTLPASVGEIAFQNKATVYARPALRLDLAMRPHRTLKIPKGLGF